MSYIVFNHNTTDDELIEKFEDKIQRLELEPLFTDEHKSTSISVSWAMLKSVVNGGSAYQTLSQFSDHINASKTDKSKDNQMYASTMLRTLNTPVNFDGLIKNIKKVNEYLSHKVIDEHKHNKWNIVWYNEELY